jgi:histone demethylase JARID1
MQPGSIPPKRLEEEFWRIVEGNVEEPVEVYYGADLDTGTVGSGFPRRGESDDAYASHPWNVNNFPKLDGVHASLLKNVHDNIRGVIVPWLYIGMMFSAFCWHVEDHLFYSINYNHYGAPKQWCAALTIRQFSPSFPGPVSTTAPSAVTSTSRP